MDRATERIAGFMAVRNGVANGYPFEAAIRSALALCDEVHVSEGYSPDATYARLEPLAAADPRIHLRRDPWPEPGPSTIPGGGGPIREVLNRVRSDLTADLLFQFDANDILPPEDVATLRSLSALYPTREIFALPYRQFLGRYWVQEEFRYRFVRNRPTIRVLWDGWTMGYHLGPGDLLRPRQGRRLIGRGLLALLQDRVAVDLPEQPIYLPRPIHRYVGLYPGPYLEKMRSKIALQSNPAYQALTTDSPELRELLGATGGPEGYDRFWQFLIDWQRAHEARGERFNKQFPYARYVPDAEHPEAIRPYLGRSGPG